MTVMHDRAGHRRTDQIDPLRMDCCCRSPVIRPLPGTSAATDAQTWNWLLQADLVTRTLNVAKNGAHAGQSVGDGDAPRRVVRYTEDRVGVVDAQQWQMARRDYEEWRQRAAKFDTTVAKAIAGQVERAQRPAGPRFGEPSRAIRSSPPAAQNRGAGHLRPPGCPEDGDNIAEDHDLQLWSRPLTPSRCPTVFVGAHEFDGNA